MIEHLPQILAVLLGVSVVVVPVLIRGALERRRWRRYVAWRFDQMERDHARRMARITRDEETP